MNKATKTVSKASARVPDMPHREAIQRLLTLAAHEAWEAEEEFKDMGKPYLRTFLEFTALGKAILALAEEILEQYEGCPYSHAHTRHWCGNINCRDS